MPLQKDKLDIEAFSQMLLNPRNNAWEYKRGVSCTRPLLICAVISLLRHLSHPHPLGFRPCLGPSCGQAVTPHLYTCIITVLTEAITSLCRNLQVTFLTTLIMLRNYPPGSLCTPPHRLIGFLSFCGVGGFILSL